MVADRPSGVTGKFDSLTSPQTTAKRRDALRPRIDFRRMPTELVLHVIAGPAGENMVNITDEAMGALRGAAELPFSETGYQCPDGSWNCALSKEVLKGLRAVVLPGETISDTIVKLAAIAGRGLN